MIIIALNALGTVLGNKYITIPALKAPKVIHPSNDKATVPLFSENIPPKAVIVKIATYANRNERIDKVIIILSSPPYLYLTH